MSDTQAKAMAEAVVNRWTHETNKGERIRDVVDVVAQAVNEEAAKHADCCVDREEIARLQAELARLNLITYPTPLERQQAAEIVRLRAALTTIRDVDAEPGYPSHRTATEALRRELLAP